MRPRTPGFTLLELLFGLATSGALAGGLMVALQSARQSARETVCAGNLKQISMAMFSYSTEYQDRIVAFTWNAQDGGSHFPDLEAQRKQGGAAALAAQAVDTLRRRAGREDIAPIDSWLPSPLATTLVLQDYLASRLPEPIVACPSDEARAQWREDPRGFAQSSALVPADANTPAGARWPYTSSYELTAAAYDFHQTSIGKPDLWPARLSQGADHAAFLVPPKAEFRQRRHADIHFPGSKVTWYDEHDRHAPIRLAGPAAPRFFADPEASPNTAFFDGHVAATPTAHANPGWHPWQPNTDSPASIRYAPQPWERNGAAGEPAEFAGVFRWTRAGLKGIDVDGAEIDPEGTIEADLPHQPPALSFTR